MNVPLSRSRASAVLRAKCIDLERSRVLVATIAGSGQEADLTVSPSCGGMARTRHFRTKSVPPFPPNPLPLLPASRWLGSACPEVGRARVFQLAACAWRCWYCYVPFDMLAGDPASGRWMHPREMLALHLAEPDAPRILDLSGGSPDLVPEWISWTMDAVEEAGAGATTYLWSDDNLSSDLLLQPEMAGILSRILSFPGHGRAFCLKGYDRASFSFNTGVPGRGFDEQLAILKGYVSVGLNLYGYVTLTSPHPSPRDGIARLLDRLQRIDETLPGRIVPLRIERFSAMAGRLGAERLAAMERQGEAVVAWLSELRVRGIRPLWDELGA